MSARGGGNGRKKRGSRGGKVHLLVGGFSAVACGLLARDLKVGATATNRESTTCARCLEAQPDPMPRVGEAPGAYEW